MRSDYNFLFYRWNTIFCGCHKNSLFPFGQVTTHTRTYLNYRSLWPGTNILFYYFLSCISRNLGLSKHNPHIDGKSGEILSWANVCFKFCLKTPSSVLASESIPSLPACYFADVFSAQVATAFPPHRHYDCPIDLLSGTTPPKCAVHPLSEPKIHVGLHQGNPPILICPSTSPAAAAFFFAQKKM